MTVEQEVSNKVRAEPMGRLDWQLREFDPLALDMSSYGRLQPVHSMLTLALVSVRWRVCDDES